MHISTNLIYEQKYTCNDETSNQYNHTKVCIVFEECQKKRGTQAFFQTRIPRVFCLYYLSEFQWQPS